MENNFIDGLIVKKPNEKAPEWIIAKLSLKRDELISWLQKQEGEWVNADIKLSKKGTYYAQVDTWKPRKLDEPY
jgi:hypothetical protein